MKHSLLFLILSAFVFFSCSKEKEQEAVVETVTVNGTITNSKTEKVTISYRTPSLDSEKITLAELGLDSTGYFEATFELAEPVQAMVSNGEYTKVYLEPGDSLSLTIDAEEFDESVAWTGIGAEKQNYFAKKMLLNEELMAKYDGGFRGLMMLELADFELAMDSILMANKGLYTEFFDSLEVSDAFKALEEAELIADWGQKKMMYPMYHKYYSDLEEFAVPDSYYVFMEEIPMDEAYLASSNFKSYLNNIVRKEFTAYTEANPQDSSVKEMSGYSLKMYEIASNLEAPGPIKDFIAASQVFDYISFSGVDSIADSLMTAYKAINIDEKNLASIEENYEKWVILSEGKPAIDFTYTSLDSTEVSLSDFVGKVVYIDVWATWCGPCMRELPSAKELHTYFGDREDLVLLYVSIDENIDAWKKLLSEDEEFRTMGVHVIGDDAWNSSINKDYMIKGIPRYILIGKDGKIADATAPRPSSGNEIKGAIEALLTAGAVSKL
ncbi:TlpA disulfide reductase family protein [Flammeovirgaceae bacterium SG7u.111]|nr:TlpA disulfide reductase family protein [Flammeovirgaceae bacterium SG7u.132]WPO34327.1 TlpA disulfide reductase family protein [Flammeovirgaceae bacterium SG7u.111]